MPPGAALALVLTALVAAPAHAESFQCMIEPANRIDVGSSVAGVLAEVYVDVGEEVEKGQPVARLESSVEEATVALARARAEMVDDIRAKQARYRFARRKAERFGNLADDSLESSSKKEEAQTEADVARIELGRARQEQRLAQLELAKAIASLERRTIRSPIDGVVVDRYLSPGETVKDAPIAKLVKIDPLRVEVILAAPRFGTVRVGEAARVIPELVSPLARQAVVSGVDRTVDAAHGTFRVRLALPNANYALPSGLQCQVRFSGEVAAPSELENKVPKVRETELAGN